MGLNLFFQRGDVIVTEVSHVIEKTFKNLVSLFMSRTYVLKTPASEIDFSNQSEYLEFINLEFGDEIKHKIIENGANMGTFFKHSLQFVTSVCIEMRTRFENFEKDIFAAFKILHPSNALDKNFHLQNQNLFELYLNYFHFLIKDKNSNNLIRNQWKELATSKQIDAKKMRQMGPEQFWHTVSLLKNEKNDFIFAELASIASTSLCVPSANADTERMFSKMNFHKDLNKTSMINETIDAIMRVSEHVKTFDVDAGGFEPTQAMVEKCATKMFYKSRH